MMTKLQMAWLCLAAAKAFSNSDPMLSPFDLLDGTSPGDIEDFQDYSWVQLETDEPLFDPGSNQYYEEFTYQAATYTPDDCSAFNDQLVGKKIRVRDIPQMCTTEGNTASDTQSTGEDNDDLQFKNSDGLQTEPKNSVGLNRYGTNSDGTICPPDMWLLCSSIQPDVQSYCLGCYPCKLRSCFY
jgi:hypothetical protein